MVIKKLTVKKRLVKLINQEKDVRVEIVHLREELLLSEQQFFYVVYHFFLAFFEDIKSLFVNTKFTVPILEQRLTLRKKYENLNQEIIRLNNYRSRLEKLKHSPFILAVGCIRFVQRIIYYIPRLIEKKKIIKELETKRYDARQIDIINFGVIPYRFRKLRQQHLAEELAKQGNRVFYIENRFIKLEKNKPRYAIEKEQNNIYIVKLAASYDIAIYHQKPSHGEIQSISTSFRHFLRDSNIKQSAVKIDYPFWTYLLPVLPKPVVYDCMDDYEGFNITGKHIIDLERKLIRTSELTLVCSDLLLKKVKKHNPRNTLLLKNACEYDHFSKATIKKDTCSAGLCWIRQPVIGFFGAIGEWIDAELVKKVAVAFPKASIVLIGEIQNPDVLKIGESFPNIFLLGEKPYSKLPQFLQTFDVCIIPFLINKHTELIDPVKLYEFFAAGKAVITTAIKEIEIYKKLLYYSSSPEEFILNIRLALKENNTAFKQKRQKIARTNTWAKRGRLLHQAIQKMTDFVYNN